MNEVEPAQRLAALTDVVAAVHPRSDHTALVTALNDALCDLNVKLVYTRKGWHRPGGVINAKGETIAKNLGQWLYDDEEDNLADLFRRYENDGLIATRLCGVTHYLSAKTGDGPWDFLQIEVDELQEFTEREVFDPSNPPDMVEDILEPVDPLMVASTPVGSPFYQIRHVWDIAEAHTRMASGGYADSLLVLRFVDDWCASGARESVFCENFVLRLSEYRDRFGEKRLQATPLATRAHNVPALPDTPPRGVALFHFLSAFDRAVGYPMAWYFHLVSGALPQMESMAHAVHKDLSNDYDYLPQHDKAVLQAWIADPYRF